VDFLEKSSAANTKPSMNERARFWGPFPKTIRLGSAITCNEERGVAVAVNNFAFGNKWNRFRPSIGDVANSVLVEWGYVLMQLDDGVRRAPWTVHRCRFSVGGGGGVVKRAATRSAYSGAGRFSEMARSQVDPIYWSCLGLSDVTTAARLCRIVYEFTYRRV